jgi:hypothetical protein
MSNFRFDFGGVASGNSRYLLEGCQSVLGRLRHDRFGQGYSGQRASFNGKPAIFDYAIQSVDRLGQPV